MAHNTSGLPPLNLEPFDPSDLYAAARTNGAVTSQPRRSRVGRLVLGLGVLVGALAVAASFLVG
ncbi:MAG TPA: hypothetical protein VFU25_00850 [Ornithinibacter sp.]|nr:hypothetical protein [Ornithinibacter sp.]